MKKLLLYIFLSLTTTLYSQDLPETILVDIGEFKALGEMFKAQAYVTKDTSLVCIYRLSAVHAFPTNYLTEYTPQIHIMCTTSLKDDLLKVSSKYKEWAKIAKDNNVGKFSKEIDVEIPIVNCVIFHSGRKGFPKTTKYTTHKFTFNLFDVEKSPSIFCNVKIQADALSSFHTGLAFRTPQEFDDFIDFLDPEKVKKRLRGGKISLFTQRNHDKKWNGLAQLYR